MTFIAPVHLCSFPAILKGRIDRLQTLDFGSSADAGRPWPLLRRVLRIDLL